MDERQRASNLDYLMMLSEMVKQARESDDIITVNGGEVHMTAAGFHKYFKEWSRTFRGENTPFPYEHYAEYRGTKFFCILDGAEEARTLGETACE